jgi:hypothetical protein
MANQLFIGVVISSTAASHTVTIARDSYATSTTSNNGYMIQATVVSSVMTSFLGFKECLVLQPGCRVLCVEESSMNCYVIGVIPDQDVFKKEEPLQFANRAILGAACASDDSANRIGHIGNLTKVFNNRRPTDKVDGEYLVGNEFGVLLGLYQQMANLKASELSQIQCFLLDDLVRIISHNFQHYTALGEYSVFHDGKALMAEFTATHKPAEAYGRPAVTDTGAAPIFEEEGERTRKDEKDFYKIKEDERIKAIERFKLFLGAVGDFINMFVVRPNPDETRKLDPSASVTKPDTGLFNLHVGSDGGVHLRSLKEVFIEKTNWIRVPLRVAAPDDPNGDRSEDTSYEPKELFKFEDKYKYKENPFNFALQIRDYISYVNEKLNYQNFKSHPKDFYVNDAPGDEEAIAKAEQIDTETKLGLSKYALRTAGIYLMPNGGITIRDAWNSSIIMEGGNVYIQPAKDLVAQPLRNFISKVGGNFNLATKKHIDLSSSAESLRIKTEKAINLYSNNSGVIIEANGETDSIGNGGTKAIEEIGGIVFKSKLNIYNYAKKDIVAYAENNMHFQSINDLNFVADQTLTCYGKERLYNATDKNGIFYSKENTFLLAKTNLTLAGQAQTSLGQTDTEIAVKTKPGVSVKGTVKVQEVLSKMDTEKFLENRKELLKLTAYQEKEKFEELKFKFLDSSAYKLNPDVDGIPSTLAQQDDAVTSLYSLESWEEKEVNESFPYPGKDLYEKFLFFSDSFENLEKNSKDSSGKELISKAESSESPSKIKLVSLNQYKVQSDKP